MLSANSDAQDEAQQRADDADRGAADKKIRMIAPRVAPMVRRIAMSRPLFFTSMVMPVMMLKAATTMIRVRIRNITLRSTCSAAKKCELSCCQSTSRTSAADARLTGRAR